MLINSLFYLQKKYLNNFVVLFIFLFNINYQKTNNIYLFIYKSYKSIYKLFTTTNLYIFIKILLLV